MFTLIQADMEHLKVALCSAFDIMQSMGSAIRPLLSQVSELIVLKEFHWFDSHQHLALVLSCYFLGQHI